MAESTPKADCEDVPGRLLNNGECRGAKPLCRECEGVPQIQNSSPFLARKGVTGMFERGFQHPARNPPWVRGI